MSLTPLQNRCYLVFGAGSGLGAATAQYLLRSGAKVWTSDLTEERSSSMEGMGTAGYTPADICDEAQVGQVLDDAVARLGRIDGVVTTAGVLHGERILRQGGAHALSQFERVVRVNLIGTFNVLRLAAEAMARNSPGEDGERGVIVNTASVAAFEGQIG